MKAPELANFIWIILVIPQFSLNGNRGIFRSQRKILAGWTGKADAEVIKRQEPSFGSQRRSSQKETSSISMPRCQ
jgi:hypothetical protein